MDPMIDIRLKALGLILQAEADDLVTNKNWEQTLNCANSFVRYALTGDAKSFDAREVTFTTATAENALSSDVHVEGLEPIKVPRA